MKREFLRTLVVALAAFSATFMVVSYDDLREFDAAYIQAERVKESAENLSAARHELAIEFSRLAARNEGKYLLGSAPIIPSPTLLAVSSCVLLC